MAKKSIKKEKGKEFREIMPEELQLSEEVKKRLPEIRHLEDDIAEEKKIIVAREASLLNEMLKEKKSKLGSRIKKR